MCGKKQKQMKKGGDNEENKVSTQKKNFKEKEAKE